MVDITKYFATAGNVSLILLVVLGILLVFGLLGWWIYRLIKYNKRAIIRTVIGNNVIVQQDWCKEYKDKKTQAYYWKLKRRKHNIPRPPPLALDVTNKGKEWVEMFYIGQGQYVPCKTEKPDFAQSPDFINTFQPITESQRQTYADQYEKSLGFQRLSLAQILQIAFPFIAVILILTVFMLFFGDVSKPLADMSSRVQDATIKVSESQLEMMRIWEKVQTGETVIGEKPPLNITPPN